MSWIGCLAALGLLAGACGGEEGNPDTITVTMTSPVAESYLSGDITVTVEVQGETDRVALFLDGAMLELVEAPPFTFTWQSDQAAEGLHRLEAFAYGPGGSQGRSGEVLVMVDRTPPELDLSGLTFPLVYSGAANELDAAASDEAGIVELRLFADGTLVDSCDLDACTFDWDVSALPTGEALLTFEAEDVAGNVSAEDVPVLVVNDGTAVTFNEGAGTTSWTIPENWRVMETDMKFHFTMPDGVTEVLAVLQWSRLDWSFELAIGTGECPDAGERVADVEGDGGQVVLLDAAEDHPQTPPYWVTYPTGMWFAHLSAGTDLDMDANIGETTRVAFIVVLY